jgi:ligand-binding sensor domain-containing protein
LLEDREGNLWAGTNLGLNRFRHRALLPLASLLPGQAMAVATFNPTPGTSARPLLASLRDGRLLALSRDRVAGLQHGAPPHILDVPATANGWVLGEHALLRLQAGRIQPVALPLGLTTGAIRAFVVDSRNHPWVCPDASGPYAFDGSAWQPLADLQDTPCTVLANTQDGGVWVGTIKGDVRLLQGRRLMHYSAEDGLSVGPVTAIWQRPSLTLVAGETGLAALGADGRFRQVPDQTNPLLQGITGIVQDRHGTLWLNGNRGVVQISQRALLRSVQAGVVSPALRLYDIMDGLPGVAQQATPVPTAIAAATACCGSPPTRAWLG